MLETDPDRSVGVVSGVVGLVLADLWITGRLNWVSSGG